MFKRFLKEWKKKEPKQKIYMAIGALFLIFAIIGVFLPLIPQIPFAIAAAFFFSKGSARIHEWIRENRYFGKPVKDWEDDRVIRTKLKVISTVAMLGGAGFAHWKIELNWALAIDLVFAAAIVFVLTRNSKPEGHSKTKRVKHSPAKKTVAKAPAKKTIKHVVKHA